MSTKKILSKVVKNGVEIHLPQNNVFVITEDKLTKTTTATKWVAPYNTDYYYTNYQISATAWVKWIEWALYTFMINTKTTASAYRNVRVQIWTGSYIPVMSSSWTILWWSSYFTKANDRIYQYSTRYESWGALHLITDSNTTYSSMSADEWKTGTATSARSLTAANLKAIIEYHAGNLHDNTKQNTLTAGEWITIDENNVISAEWWGGGADVETVNALIDWKLWNYDTLFKIEDWLYKILNELDDKDNLWLESGDTRADIVWNATNMSKVSHSRAVMTKVVNSPYAIGLIVNSSNGMKEVSECWNSMTIIASNTDSAISYLTSPYVNTYINTAIVQDAFNYENLIPYMPDSLFTSMYLEDSTKVAEIPTNSELKDRLNKMTPDALLPAIFYRTNLSGYSTFESLCQNSSAIVTLMNNTNAMIIVNNHTEAKAIFEQYSIYNISVVASNPSMLASCLKNADWVAYFSSSEHNAELQSEKTNLYNTVVNNSSYFTQYTRTYQDWVTSLNNSTKVSNAIVFFAWWYWSSTSQYSNMFHSNWVQAVSANTYYRPSSVSATQLSWVSFSNATFTETGDWYAAIAVYTAN